MTTTEITVSGERYVACGEADVPESARFDVPGHRQGQIVEYAFGGHSCASHCEGDAYMRITDRSDGSVRCCQHELTPPLGAASLERTRK